MAKARFISKVMKSEKLKSYIKATDLYLSNFDKPETQEKIEGKNREILYYYYYLLENTEFKDNIIDQHNKDYVNDIQLSTVMLSPKTFPNDIKGIKPREGKKTLTYDQVLEHSSSKDLVTKDFKDNEYAELDELFQKVSSWSNRFAHACDAEIVSVSGSMNFDVYESIDPTKKHNATLKEKKNFPTKLFKAYKDYKTDLNFSCDIDDILENIDEFAEDLSTDSNANVQKMLSLIKKYYPNQIVDKEFLRKYTYCMKLEDRSIDFFEMKNIAIKELLLYQDRKKELNKQQGDDLYEEQNVITFIVPDTVKTKENKDTCRVVSLTKSEYDRYIKYNDNYSFSTTHINTYAYKHGIYDYEAQSYMEDACSGGKRLTATERKALMAKCAVNSYHIPVDELESFIENKGIQNVNRDYPPMIECFAYSGSALYDITPSKEKEKVLENILARQEKRCKENKNKYSRYADPEARFNKDNSIEEHLNNKMSERGI